MAKKNAKGGGTIRQKANGTWEGRYTIGRDPGTGKQIQKSVYGSTQKEVRQKLAQVVAAIDAGTYSEPCKMTLAQWLDTWEMEYLGGVKPRTAALYKSTTRNYIRPALGAVKLEALNASDIQSLYNKLGRERDGKPPLSPKSIKNVHGIMHKALQKAVELRYIKFNPADACELPRAEKPEIKPLDESDTAKFLEAIKGHTFETVFTTAIFTGMREAELLGLRWDCIDFERGKISVNKQLQRIDGEYRLVSPKNGKGRVINPAPFVMSLLKSHRAKQSAQQIQAGPAWEGSGLVFCNEVGHHLYPNTIYQSFKRVAARIGIPSARFHDLRHSYAVSSIRAGDDIKTVQTNLGHATASFTLDQYGHVTEEMRQASAQRMEDYIKRVSNL